MEPQIATIFHDLMMKMFILATTLPLLPHDSCQQFSPTHIIPHYNTEEASDILIQIPLWSIFLPTHTCYSFPYKNLLRYEGSTYPIKFPWQYDSDALQTVISSAPSTSFAIHTLATCFSPISHDPSSGSDIGFHTIELLLTFDAWFCNLHTYFP